MVTLLVNKVTPRPLFGYIRRVLAHILILRTDLAKSNQSAVSGPTVEFQGYRFWEDDDRMDFPR
jgi:hypothetical protein